MTQGIVLKTESKALRPNGSRWFLPGAAALCLYFALWGCLWDMAGASSLCFLPLAAGGVLAAVLVLTPTSAGKWCDRRRWLLAAGGLAALLILVRPAVFWDGCKLLLNRLFAASEARQSYTYEMFSVRSGGGALFYALLSLGLLSGTVWGGAIRYGRRWLCVLPILLLCAAGAYLGVSPRWPWLALLALALVLVFLAPAGESSPSVPAPAAMAVLLALGAVCAAVLLAFPGEDAALSAWEETARDRLAAQTVAYVEAEPSTSTPPPQREKPEPDFFQLEGAPGTLGGFDLPWSRPLSALLVILFFALLLFLPAILSDRLKRKREKNRAWMEEENVPAAVRAGFLYSLRWLKLGGMTPANIPFSGYLPAVEKLFSPALGARFGAVLPLWQEAAYSEHPMTPGQREEMVSFAQEVRRTVWDGLGKKDRFLAKYIYAL